MVKLFQLLALLPWFVCASVAGLFKGKAQAHKKEGASSFWVHSSPGWDDPDLYDSEGNEYRLLHHRWMRVSVAAGLLGGAVAFWLQLR